MKLGALADMAILVQTKDCTALSDAELAEMADLCAAVDNGHDIGVLSKQVEAWVLVTLAHRGEQLAGFSYCTLERIGGTPSVLIGMSVVDRSPDTAELLQAVMHDQYRRAVLAFPDEDVLVASRLVSAVGFDAYAELNDLIPRPGHKASGEERAWGRRLAKRFGIDSSAYDDRTFRAKGDGTPSCALDFVRVDGTEAEADVAAFLEGLDVQGGDVLVGFGWAMARDFRT